MNLEQFAALKTFLRAIAIPPEIESRILNAGKESAPVADILIKTREAAEALGCHRQTLFRYRQRGLLHSVQRSPRCIRWRKSEVVALAEGRTP